MATLKLAIDARNLIHNAEKATTAIKGIKRSAETTFNAVKRAANIALGPLKAMVAVTASLKAAMLAAGAASIGAAADYEVLELRLKKVIGSKKEADRAFKESLEFSSATPYTIDKIVELRIALEQMGISGSNAVTDVADMAAAMGRDVMDVVAAVRSLEREPLRNLGLTDEMLDKITALKSKGTKEARLALLDIFEMYKGTTAELSITWRGLVSTMGDNVKRLRAAFGKGFLDEAKLFVNDIINAAAQLREYAKEAGEAFGDEMMHARAAILSGFDIALKMAGQIKDVMKQEGGIGQVVLAALELGATLLGKAIFTAFEISLPLWKTIGTILGQGVLNALYQSGLPFTDRLRARAIGKTLGSKEYGDLVPIAEKFGIDPNEYSAGYKEMKGPLITVTPVVRYESKQEALLKAITKEIGKLSIEEQLEYAEFDPASTIAKSIQDSKDTLVREVKELGTEAVTALQDFENKIANAAGQEPVDVLAEFNQGMEKHLKEGEKLIEDWRNKLDASGDDLANNMQNQFNGIAESSKKASENIRQVLSPIESHFERAIFEGEKLKDVINSLATDIQRIMFRQMVTEPLMTKLTQLFTPTKTATQQTQQAVGGAATSGVLDNFANRTEQTLDKHASAVTNSTDKLAGGISNSLSNFGEGLGGLLSNLGGMFGNILGGLGNAAGGLLSGVGNIIGNGISGILGMIPFFDKGGVFSTGRLVPMAAGELINGPTYFPMAGGKVGLMGEAGPEAVMPLTRTTTGKLGVRVEDSRQDSNIPRGGDVHVSFNVSAIDAAGVGQFFSRNNKLIASAVKKAMEEGHSMRKYDDWG